MSQNTYQGVGNMSYGGAAPQNHGPVKGQFRGNNFRGYTVINIILLVLIILLSVFLFLHSASKSRGNIGENAAVEGQWVCTDASDFQDFLVDIIVQETGLSWGEVWGVLDTLGLADAAEQINFDFANGDMKLRFHNFSAGVDMVNFGYETRGDGKLSLSIHIQLPPVYGVSLPEISVSYLADYRAGDNWMIIKVDDYWLNFERD